MKNFTPWGHSNRRFPSRFDTGAQRLKTRRFLREALAPVLASQQNEEAPLSTPWFSPALRFGDVQVALIHVHVAMRPSDADLHLERAVRDGLHDAFIVALGLVGVGLGERGDGLVEPVGVA